MEWFVAFAFLLAALLKRDRSQGGLSRLWTAGCP